MILVTICAPVISTSLAFLASRGSRLIVQYATISLVCELASLLLYHLLSLPRVDLQYF